MRYVVSILLLFILSLATVSWPAFAGVGEGISYLEARQDEDGGFSEPEESSSGVLTAWSLLAGLASIEDSSSWLDSMDAAVEFLYVTAGELTKLDEIELYTLAISEADSDPRDADGIDLVSLVKAHVGDDGKMGKNLDEHCWGIISLVSAGEKVDSKSTGWLVSKQREDGGWGDSDADLVRQTALSVEALVAAGEADTGNVRKALKFLRDRMGADGGFAGASSVSDGRLTATVVRAIYAAGDNPASSSWTFQGANPLTFLSSLQAPDGHYRFSSGVDSEPAMTTAMVLPAISGKHLPLKSKGAEAALKEEQGPDEPIHDLGTAGASAEAGGSKENVEDKTDSASDTSSSTTGSPGSPGVSGVSAGAFGRKSTWFSGLWLFLLACVAYILVLVAAALLTGKSASSKRGKAPRTNHFSAF